MSILKVSIRQIKAARSLLGWAQEQLAAAANVSLPTIKRLEALDGPLRGRNETGQKIRQALQKAGIEFIDEKGGGAGVRQIPPDVLKLAENKNALDAVKNTMKPTEAYEARMGFSEGGPSFYGKEQVPAIVRSCDAGPDPISIEDANPQPKTVTVTLHVYSPVYDDKAKLWRFTLGDKHIYADISETSIAKEALKRGASYVNDRYRVRMAVTPPESEGQEPQYKIKQVLDFTPAPQQTSFPFPRPHQRKNKRK